MEYEIVYKMLNWYQRNFIFGAYDITVIDLKLYLN